MTIYTYVWKKIFFLFFMRENIWTEVWLGYGNGIWHDFSLRWQNFTTLCLLFSLVFYCWDFMHNIFNYDLLWYWVLLKSPTLRFYEMGGLFIWLGQSSAPKLAFGVELGPRSISLHGIRAWPIPILISQYGAPILKIAQALDVQPLGVKVCVLNITTSGTYGMGVLFIWWGNPHLFNKLLGLS